MNTIEFTILLRSPEYPVIIISDKGLYSAFDIEELANACMSSNLTEGDTTVNAIDSTGSEFWYMPDKNFISPGFVAKKWTKKKIIELYNNSSNAKNLNISYPLKSLSSKRLAKILTLKK